MEIQNKKSFFGIEWEIFLDEPRCVEYYCVNKKRFDNDLILLKLYKETKNGIPIKTNGNFEYYSMELYLFSTYHSYINIHIKDFPNFEFLIDGDYPDIETMFFKIASWFIHKLDKNEK